MNLIALIKSFTSFIIGSLIIMIGYPLVDELLTALSTGTYALSSTTQGIIWLGLILTWVGSTIIMPVYWITTSLREQDNYPSFVKIIIGVLVFFFSILLTTQGWFMVTAVADAFTTTTQTVFFWIGFLINWSLITLVTPIYHIGS